MTSGVASSGILRTNRKRYLGGEGMAVRILRILVWANLLGLLLIFNGEGVGVCQMAVPDAVSTPPPCVPPFAIQQPATPKAAVGLLMAGNARFVAGATKLYAPRPNQCPWGSGQTPYAIIVSCSDARVPPEILFDTGNNQIFIVRVAGNTVGNPHIDPPEFPPLGQQNSLMFQSALYAAHLSPSIRKGVKLVFVLGHSDCGAVKEAIGPGMFKCPSTLAITQNICPAVKAVPSGDLDATIRQNVIEQVNLLKSTPPFSNLIRDPNPPLMIIGGVYNIATGKVTIVTPIP